MTTDQQPPQFTISELGAKFGSQMAQALSELITLEKMIESQRAQIEAMAKNEARLVDHIQDLENEVSLIRSENSELEEMMKQVQTAAKPALSAEEQRLADEARQIIRE
jgi:predicted nuclease with TOPRIM domain